MPKKQIALGFLLLLLAASTAFADEVTISTTTTGAFSAGTTGVSFAGTTNTNTTVGGVGQLNLGTFTLGTSPAVYTGKTFTVDVTFNLPVYVAGGQNTTFTAHMFGQILNNPLYGDSICFYQSITPDCSAATVPSSATQSFTFTNAQYTGWFTVTPVNLRLSPSGSTTLNLIANTTGAQTPNPTPEPASILLFGSGLSGVAALLRRRRHSS